MNVLVLNPGSSSVKFSLFHLEADEVEPHLLLDGEMSGMGTPQVTLAIAQGEKPQSKRTLSGSDNPNETIGAVLDAVTNANVGTVDAVGYRVVHPGPHIQNHTLVTEEVLKELEAAADFAPLHDPQAVAMMREGMHRMPHIPHVACFDTVFHQTMPDEASTYAIPKELRAGGVKRYGFHGLSCESAIRQLRTIEPLPSRIVIAHLGSGCSVTAVLDGKSIDTTMGLTPTGGVVMGTRPGDLDPGLLLYILRQQTSDDAASKVEHMLNHDAGMVALTGLPNDMKAVREAAAAGNDAAVLALKVFTRSIRKAIGSFAWLMGGLDAIVFTGGIGEHDAATRAEILVGSEVLINSSLNDVKGTGVRRIEASESKTAIFAVTAQEDLVIALHVRRVVQVDA
jgi:acetate kinase